MSRAKKQQRNRVQKTKDALSDYFKMNNDGRVKNRAEEVLAVRLEGLLQKMFMQGYMAGRDNRDQFKAYTKALRSGLKRLEKGRTIL